MRILLKVYDKWDFQPSETEEWNETDRNSNKFHQNYALLHKGSFSFASIILKHFLFIFALLDTEGMQ